MSDFPWLLFEGDHYYPEGGVYDFVGRFATEDEAKAKTSSPRDWSHIAELTDTGLVLRWYRHDQSDGWKRAV